MARRHIAWALFPGAMAAILASCGGDEQGSGGATNTGASTSGTSSSGSGGTGPIPVGAAAQGIFVPRVVAADGTQAIWNDRQRSAIFWFGRIGARDDSTEVRVGYGDDFIMVHAAVLDREIHDGATDDALEAWDSLRLLIDLDGGSSKATIDARSLRIDAQAHRQGTDRSVVYRGEAGTWKKVDVPIGGAAVEKPPSLVLVKAYRGEAQDQSRGWHVTFFIPWSFLDLDGPPAAPADTWRVALRQFDRDSADGSLKGTPQAWPGGILDDQDPSSWGTWQLVPGTFATWESSGSAPGHGQPAYAISAAPVDIVPGTEATITIRRGLDSDVIEEGSVGASETLCSGDDSYNFGDGPASFGGHTGWSYFHVQNQEDYADWPCFARIYLKFPLEKLPAGKVVVAARLRLHHKEPTSGGSEGERSLIQAFLVGNQLRSGERWTSDNLSWNEAPLPLANLAGCWGDRTGNVDTGWDALPLWEWDVTRGVQRAAGDAATEVSFALYSADGEYHTGKQFVNSGDFADWGDPGQRPTLEITYADRKETP